MPPNPAAPTGHNNSIAATPKEALILRAVDRLNLWAGTLSALMVLVVTVIAVLTAFGRKFGIGSNALIELQWYLFAMIFLMAAGWTLQRNEHVRVDVFSRRFSARWRAVIDLIGHTLVLLPIAGVLFYLGLQETLDAWRSHELSADAGGLVRWPVKALIPIGFLLLILQALVEMTRQWHIFRSHSQDDNDLISSSPASATPKD